MFVATVVIQNWQIAVIVVGGLAIVAMVFCLVGLCFACQNSKQKGIVHVVCVCVCCVVSE